jgi:hypothetical protein
MRKFILLICALMALGLAAVTNEEQPASFIAFETEQLFFELSDSLMIFDGVFTFSNLSAMAESRDIFFPIIVDSDQAFYDSLSVTSAEMEYPMRVIKQKGGFWFRLEMEERSIDTINIRYQQKLNSPRAKYILLSANSWPRSLSYAEYTVSLDKDKKIIHYPFEIQEEASIQGDKQIYSWKFYEFSPTRDFFIEWE